MDEEIKFEDLTSVEQQKKLKEVMAQIKTLQKAEIQSGEIDIADISFFRLSNNDVAYDIATNNPDGTVGHIYYQESDNALSRIDIESKEAEIDGIKNQLALYNGNGMELAPIQNELMTKEQFLDSLNNPDKISLTSLELVDKQCRDLAIQLGIDFDEVALIVQNNPDASLNLLSPEELKKVEESINLAEINPEDALENIKIENGDVAIDSKAFDMSGMQSSTIEGNKKITTNSTFNQVLGLNYDSYKIIITKSGNPLIVGISQDGSAEIIPENRVEINRDENKSMSLIRDDGSIKNVGVLVSFRVKDSGSQLNRDQAVGLYSDNGSVNGFYARNATDGKMIGEELPSTSYSANRIQNERILDTQENRDISSEARSAQQRTDDGCIDNIENIGNGETHNMYEQKDTVELIEKYATEYEVDSEDLQKRYDHEVEHSHGSNLTDEDIIKQIAEEMDQEERHEPSLEPRHNH